jgi:hypothetical protein
MVGGFVLDYLLNRTQLQARAALLQRERHEVHGAPSTRSAIDTERHRHGAPSTRSAIDTERHRHGASSIRRPRHAAFIAPVWEAWQPGF